MALRLDKYVWCVRLAKTRLKPSKEPKPGDILQFSKNTALFSYKIIQLLDKRIGAKLVEEYILDITPDEEVEKLKLYNLSQAVYRENGTGKPSKKDRRDINDFYDF